MSLIPQDKGRAYDAEEERHDGDMTIAATTTPSFKNMLPDIAMAKIVIDTLAYVAGEIKAGRFVGHRKDAPATTILHNCKFSIEAIRSLGLTRETQLFALRALYPSVGRVERKLFPVLAGLLLSGTEEPAAAGRPGEPGSDPPIWVGRK
jgi:hypothetical protein